MTPANNHSRSSPEHETQPRIGILVVAYNAAATLVQTLERIPPDFRMRLTGILVSDDSSQDSTYEIGLNYANENLDLPLTVIRQECNLGYGGNQKFGYQWAIDNDIDIVVLLHGDGQYAPEFLPEIVRLIELDEADAVMGSRMLVPGAARRGGMPLYKNIGNRILTRFENWVTGAKLSEWHSGYRAYRVASLQRIPFGRNSNGFDFDTQIIVQLIESEAIIREIPIPTYYGDEISHVNGLRYAWDITKYVSTYRLHRIGFGSGELAFASEEYEEKRDAGSSHMAIIGMINRSGLEILDLGCGPGYLAERLSSNGNRVVGIDFSESPREISPNIKILNADLSNGIPSVLGHFDVIVAADVLEHFPDPGRLLDDIRSHLTESGELIASVPNFAHWYPRLRVALGLFGYDRRGILDRGHLRFFTRSSFARLAENAGYDIEEVITCGLPFEVRSRGGADDPTRSITRESLPLRIARTLDRLLVRVWPSMFAYQFVFRMRPSSR